MKTFAGIPIELLDAFGLGVFLLFGIVHLDLWLRRRNRVSHLWLAAASGGALVVDLTGLMIRARGGPDLPGWLFLGNVLAVAVTTVSLSELVSVIGRVPTGRSVRALEGITVAIAPLAGLFAIVQASLLTFVFCFALLVIAMVRAVFAGRQGDRESRMIAGGLLVLIATLLADLSMELKFIESRPGLPILGFTFLFLMTQRALSHRYEREYRELVELRERLEARVHERTRELEEANARLEEMSSTDALTGLSNRRGFVDASTQEITRAVRGKAPWSIAIADLDHFKAINDRLGHAAGDEVLRQAGAVLRQALRAQDLAGRWGGEEFIFFLPETDVSGAVVAAETLRRAIAAHRFLWNGEALKLTISLGVAEHAGQDTFDATIAAADRALYRAKREGRDRVAAE